MIARALINIFRIPDLIKRLAFTLFVLIVYRIGTFIPVPGVNINAIKAFMSDSSLAGSFFNFIDLFSAGNLSQCTLFALGVGPAITASIFMQVAGFTIPTIQALSKEGEYGRSIINRYTRYLSLILSIVYSISYAFYLESVPEIIINPGLGFKIVFVLSLVAGCMIVMWLGDQIKILGMGNGTSMIIFASIVSRFPAHFSKTMQAIKVGSISPMIAVLILVIFVTLAACIVFLEKGDRRIPVHYARRVVGNRLYGGQSSYIPFKINTVGVMPVIFANSLLNIPIFIIRLLAKYAFFSWLLQLMNFKGFMYNALLFGLIIFFSYIYTALAFNADDLADNLKKSGGFIPGIRPGKQTAKYFDYVLVRIGLAGSIYLAVLAVFPNIIPYFVPAIPFDLGGTSLLIVVGVALEFIVQIQSYLLEHHYEGFLPSRR